MRSVRLAFLVTLLTVACSHGGGEARDSGTAAAAASETVPGPLDDLDIRLELPTSEVPRGGELRTTRVVENRSGRTITESRSAPLAYPITVTP
jgi:hypothetical protein